MTQYNHNTVIASLHEQCAGMMAMHICAAHFNPRHSSKAAAVHRGRTTCPCMHKCTGSECLLHCCQQCPAVPGCHAHDKWTVSSQHASLPTASSHPLQSSAVARPLNDGVPSVPIQLGMHDWASMPQRILHLQTDILSVRLWLSQQARRHVR